MTGQQQQILTAFEQLGMTVDEIALDNDVEVLSVKSTLLQYSEAYRNSCKVSGEKEDTNFTGNDLEEANQVILSLMRHAEDENLRGRMAKYIRDDKKGRLDALSGLGKININVAIFNQQLLKARQAKERSKLNGNGHKAKSLTLEAELVT